MSESVNMTADLWLSGRAQLVRVRPIILHAAVASLLIFSAVHAAATYKLASHQPSTEPAVSLSTAASHQPTNKTTASQPSGGAAAPAIAPTAPKPTQVIPVLPACTPDSYAGTAALDLSSSPAGLSQVVEATHYYQIYGYNAAQARQQITQCAPRLSSGNDDFTGYTSYRLNWLYNYGDNGSGQCTLSNIKIGMHIGEVLPALQLSQYADSGFAAKWQAFVPALDTHEHGHIALDEQYASKILSDLQSFPASDCGTISQAATNLISSDIAVLDQANSTYDAQTNHGATQGALLP